MVEDDGVEELLLLVEDEGVELLFPLSRSLLDVSAMDFLIGFSFGLMLKYERQVSVKEKSSDDKKDNNKDHEEEANVWRLT